MYDVFDCSMSTRSAFVSHMHIGQIHLWILYTAMCPVQDFDPMYSMLSDITLGL